jgi:hypothetical protein
LYYPEYRKLLIRSYVLSLRLELLCTFFSVVSPFATPGLLRMIRGWLDQLRRDVAEFGRVVRMPRARIAIPREQATPRAGHDSGFQNPWT